jgi:hypothetical protein
MMAKRIASRDLAATDNVVGACVITDQQSGAQTTRCGTKDQCDTWGGVFMGPPCGFGAEVEVAGSDTVAPEKAVEKAAKQKTSPKKGGAKK